MKQLYLHHSIFLANGKWRWSTSPTLILINLKEYHLAVLTIFRDDEEEQKQHILGDAKTNGLILGMDDV